LTAEPAKSSHTEAVFLDPLRKDLPLQEWRALGAAALDPNPFFGPAFLRPLLDHMGPRSVRLLVLRHGDGQWRLAAPVGRRRLGLGMSVQTSWATDYSPLGTPLIHPDAEEDELRTFLQTAAGPKGLFAIPFLPLTSVSAQRLARVLPQQTTVLARSERASHAGGAEGEAQLALADSGKRRKERRRLLRRLEDHGQVRFTSLSGQDAVQGFEAFLHLEAAGWKGRAGTALLSLPETAAFARLAIAECAGADGIRIDQLWAGETLVATLVLFQQADQVFSWKIAFDENFARYSPGAQIALRAFRNNLDRTGFAGADSLAVPGHSMIEPLWRGRQATGTLLYSQGPLAALKREACRLDVMFERGARRAARALKRRLLP